MYMDCILLFTTSQCKPNLVDIATGKISKYFNIINNYFKNILGVFICIPQQIKSKS